MFKRIRPNNAIGLMLVSMGVGMLLVILIPAWALLLAIALIGAGGWLLFMC